MKILFITPSFHHPTVRGPNHCYHFVKQLRSRHQISLLTLKRSEISPEALKEVEGYVKELWVVDATGGASSRNGKKGGTLAGLNKKIKTEVSFRTAVQEMKRAFLEMVNKESYDLVFFHGKSIFSVIEDWNELPIVIYFCDATSMRYRDRMQFDASIKKVMLMRRYRYFRNIEKKIVEKTPHVAFISARDRNASIDQNNGFKIVPIGVDLEFWKRKTRSPRKNSIVFTGVMNYGPNEDAALYLIHKILPAVRPRMPHLEVLIVGREPTPALEKAAKKYRDVVVTGFVDDVRNYLERASVFVAPIRYGSGIQNKVLEAFAMEVPVICTPVVAEGLYMDDNQKLPVWAADGEEKFAAGLIELLADEKERTRLAAEGRNYVEKNFVWSHSAELLDAMFLEAAGKQRVE